jgi:hypothetical protein
MAWLKNALTILLGKVITSLSLPDVIPGTVNPMMWRMAPSWLAPSLSELQPGFESFWALLIR